MSVITAHNLTKNYLISARQEGFWGSLKGLFHRETKTVEAVKGINLSVEAGELVAFLGPNGAGKTTTLKMLSGLLYPSGGTMDVMGHVPFQKHPDFLRRFSFVMGQRHQLWWELPAMDTFRLNAAVFEIPLKRFNAKLEELDAFLQLDPLWHTPVKKLSLGQRMKMELACSLLHEPELLLLDEPTLGLDVVMQKVLRDAIARMNREKNITVLLTSHNMEDIESLCKRVIVIHHGVLLYDGELNALVNQFVPAKRVRADLKENIPESRLRQYGDLRLIDNVRVEWEIDRAQVAGSVGKILADLPVLDLAVEEMPLEDVIRRVFKEGKV